MREMLPQVGAPASGSCPSRVRHQSCLQLSACSMYGRPGKCKQRTLARHSLGAKQLCWASCLNCVGPRPSRPPLLPPTARPGECRSRAYGSTTRQPMPGAQPRSKRWEAMLISARHHQLHAGLVGGCTDWSGAEAARHPPHLSFPLPCSQLPFACFPLPARFCTISGLQTLATWTLRERWHTC